MRTLRRPASGRNFGGIPSHVRRPITAAFRLLGSSVAVVDRLKYACTQACPIFSQAAHEGPRKGDWTATRDGSATCHVTWKVDARSDPRQCATHSNPTSRSRGHHERELHHYLESPRHERRRHERGVAAASNLLRKKRFFNLDG